MLKRTTEEVRQYFKEHNCVLLGEYTGAMNKMDYICSCGTQSKINWNKFSNGRRCGYCGPTGRKKKYTLKEVKNIFLKRNCVLLEETYVDNKQSMKYKCNCGNESKISLVGFLHQEQNCYQCGLVKIQGSNHPQWKSDRTKHREDVLFRKKCYKALSASLKATNKKKVGRTSDMIGYGPKELQAYITNHPKWSEVKDKNWHLDHIFPIQAFLDFGIKDLKLINALENLQPMVAKDNISKSDNYDKKIFTEWLSIWVNH